jgi:hypothetical protein
MKTKTPESIQLEDILIRHKEHIKRAKLDYTRDITYAESMEILTYIEKKLGRNIPLNHSCPQCVLDVYKLFIRITDC